MIQEKTPTLSKGMMTKMGMGMGLDLVQKVPLMMYNHTQSDRVPYCRATKFLVRNKSNK